MFCPDCEANLDDVPVGDPCPVCGGPRRSAEAHAGVALMAVSSLKASASVGYNPQRPWQQKWSDVVHGLEVLEEIYRRDDLGNEDVRRQVEDFFKDCRELADWLKQQAGTPQAMSYVNTDPDLMLCDGLAQTVKHHTRSGADPITARISWVHGGSGVRVEIAWSTPSGATGIEDALALARRCVKSWERFFQQEGLNPRA